MTDLARITSWSKVPARGRITGSNGLPKAMGCQFVQNCFVV
jgi:hypothetical protein